MPRPMPGSSNRGVGARWALPFWLLPSRAGAGFVAFERRDFSGAIEALAPLEGQNERIGGSRAQHDLIEFTLLKAYINADRLEEARRLLRVRRLGSSGVPVTGLAMMH